MNRFFSYIMIGLIIVAMLTSMVVLSNGSIFLGTVLLSLSLVLFYRLSNEFFEG